MQMNALKFFSFIPFAFLIACATTNKGSNENLNTNANPIAKIKTERPGQDPTLLNKAEKMSLENTQPATQKMRASSSKKPNAWELSGVMAARNKQKSWTAQINWLQSGSSAYQIRLFGPIGSGTILISRQGGAVSFRDGSKSATSKNADELLQQQTGIRLPVNNLYYWVRGLPAPGGISSEQRGSSNELLVLKQGGYTIEYPEYTQANSSILPRTIRLQGNGVSIKLVVKQWKV